jgi:hypothetical protein
LCAFAALTSGLAWLAYQRMIEQEKRL